MKKYETPEMEIEEFSKEELITLTIGVQKGSNGGNIEKAG